MNTMTSLPPSSHSPKNTETFDALKLSAFSVLILEDEPHIADLIELTLRPIGAKILKAENVHQAKQFLTQMPIDLILADWMLPDSSGIEVISFIKSEIFSAAQSSSPSSVPVTNAGAVKSVPQIMMVTAKGDADSIVRALELGADDFLVKPFEPDVLLARVQNLLRRADLLNKILNGRNEKEEISRNIEVLEHRGLEMNFDRVEVKLNQEMIALTQSEFKLLGHLLRSKGKVLTRESLIEKIQGSDVNVTNRTIDTHVFALRKKLGTWSNHIETIRGVGYRIHF